MKIYSNNIRVFFALLRAGLWEQDARLSDYGQIDFNAIYQIAEDQSVIGLIAAGLEHVTDMKVPKEILLQFIGQTLQLEQRNLAMNKFIASLIEELRQNDVYSILVKGQGVAQCYERPLWRACGDVDLFLDVNNYKKANSFLRKKGNLVSPDSKKNIKRLNAEYDVNEWLVELHGTQHANLSNRMDKTLDQIQSDVFSQQRIRVWRNGQTDVYLPASTEDVVFVFAHILQHLFLGGIGLRQVCDWCRLLWDNRDSIDMQILETHIKKMGIMTEWKVFSCIAVEALGMPYDSLPLYDASYKKNSIRLLEYIVEVGNFGHNKDYSYINKYSGLRRKSITLWRQTKDSMRLARVFPIDAPRFLGRFVINGLREIL